MDLDEDNSSALVGTAASFLALTIVAVALRTYVRAGLTRNFKSDDWLMLVAEVRHPPRLDQPARMTMLTPGTGHLHHIMRLHPARSQGRTRTAQRRAVGTRRDRGEQVAGAGHGHLRPQHDVHQAQLRHLPAQAGRAEAL